MRAGFKKDSKTDVWGSRSLLEKLLMPWTDRQRDNRMVGNLKRLQALAPGTDSLAKALKRGPRDRRERERFHSKRLHPGSLVYRLGSGKGRGAGA